MKQTVGILSVLMLCSLSLSGCQIQPDAPENISSKQSNIPYLPNQTYAVAHLGYQKIERLSGYASKYLDSDQLPIHYLSAGDYYLVIPRYEGMELYLYENDINTSDSTLIYQEPNCQPFIIQCNVSDIFADATIQLSYDGTVSEFSPFISLKDGSLDIGSNGLLLTLEENSST